MEDPASPQAQDSEHHCLIKTSTGKGIIISCKIIQTKNNKSMYYYIISLHITSIGNYWIGSQPRDVHAHAEPVIWHKLSRTVGKNIQYKFYRACLGCTVRSWLHIRREVVVHKARRPKVYDLWGNNWFWKLRRSLTVAYLFTRFICHAIVHTRYHKSLDQIHPNTLAMDSMDSIGGPWPHTCCKTWSKCSPQGSSDSMWCHNIGKWMRCKKWNGTTFETLRL